jgi:hypothetical protein
LIRALLLLVLVGGCAAPLPVSVSSEPVSDAPVARPTAKPPAPPALDALDRDVKAMKRTIEQ